MPRPPLAGPGGTASRSSPRAATAAGRSALAVWKQERRTRRRRLALVVVLSLVSAGALGTWAAASVGVVWLQRPLWPLLALSICAAFAVLLFWPRSDPSRWARGAAGEIVTAALLEKLPRTRWVVLHDLGLPGSRANVDHLVIGPTGVWVVDTKAYRGRVVARRRQILVAGVPIKTASVCWEAEVVSGLLGVGARPVIAVHARGLPRRGRRVSGVKVLPAGRLVRRLRRGQHMWPRLGRRGVRELGQLAERSLTRAW